MEADKRQNKPKEKAPAAANVSSAKNEETKKKMEELIDRINYWNSSDTVFHKQIAKDFEEIREIYKEHDCRGLQLDKGGSVLCRVCRLHEPEMGWTTV